MPSQKRLFNINNVMKKVFFCLFVFYSFLSSSNIPACLYSIYIVEVNEYLDDNNNNNVILNYLHIRFFILRYGRLEVDILWLWHVFVSCEASVTLFFFFIKSVFFIYFILLREKRGIRFQWIYFHYYDKKITKEIWEN